MAMYESEFTGFMQEFLSKNPQVVEEQKQLRLTWWEKEVSLDDQRRWKESAVRQKPYPYQTN